MLRCRYLIAFSRLVPSFIHVTEFTIWKNLTSFGKKQKIFSSVFLSPPPPRPLPQSGKPSFYALLRFILLDSLSQDRIITMEKLCVWYGTMERRSICRTIPQQSAISSKVELVLWTWPSHLDPVFNVALLFSTLLTPLEQNWQGTTIIMNMFHNEE